MTIPAAVNPPAVIPPRYGIDAAAATPPTGEGDRWLGGIRYEPAACFDPGRTPLDLCDPGSKDASANADQVDYRPFAIYGIDECSAVDRGRNREALARQNLEGTRSFQIARELWAGALADAKSYPNRWFTDGTADTVSSSAMTPAEALGCLEDALGDCLGGARGMIHATRKTVTAWAEANLVQISGPGIITTIFDTIVVPDAGYPGTGPDGEPVVDGSVWAYGTSLVTVRRSPVQVLGANEAERMTRSVNTITTIVEQVVAATWDGCCLLAVELDLPICAVGS